MSKPVLVQSKSHKNLKVDYDPKKLVGPSPRNCTVITQEFQRLASDYPILFTKNPDTGQFAAVAIFGFEEGENLFIQDNLWTSHYIPLNIQRQPFMIGTQDKSEGEAEHVMLLDEDDTRVQRKAGEALFNERDFPTPFLERMASMLKTLKDGVEQTQRFIETMLALNLVAPATFDIQFENGEKRQIKGLYTLDQEKLQALSGKTVSELHQQGYLEAAYMMLASLGQVQHLIDRKNARQSDRAN